MVGDWRVVLEEEVEMEARKRRVDMNVMLPSCSWSEKVGCGLCDKWSDLYSRSMIRPNIFSI